MMPVILPKPVKRPKLKRIKMKPYINCYYIIILFNVIINI